jgi:acyl transferase domain-containing protein
MAEPIDIAIVGMAGLFPKAPNADIFWSNILNKVDAISDPPEGWLADDKLFDPEAPVEEMRLYTKRGGFLGETARFDPRPFGAMPIAVFGGEPDQFLALKCASEALADAGLGGDADFARERTGCILGHAIHANRANVNGTQHGIILDQTIDLIDKLFPDTSTEQGKVALKKFLRKKLERCGVDTMPALIPNMMTGRICNRLDLMGPNYIMDAACASTTLAIESAVSELRRGRADIMLAGGVNTSTSPLVFGLFCQLGALSRTAKVGPFSKGGDGTLLGEGQGIFVLKRLEDALKADDRIYAVIKSIGSASDGRSSGLMAPRMEGEALAMRRAYDLAGIDPASIDLVEAHGTGIPLGDRTEIDAMREIFGGRRRRYPDAALGSVKSMIGHCIPAAGAASIIKCAMGLYEKILPPTLCDEINPELGLETTRFYINTETRPWISDPSRPRRAAVNAFGFGGINSHLILEESPLREKDATAAFGVRRLAGPELLCFAGETRESLFAEVDATRAKAHGATPEAFADFADAQAQKRHDGAFRLAILADGWNDLAAKLDTARGKLAEAEVFASRNGIWFRAKPVDGKIAFLFPGENSQYVGMLGRTAIASPMVREWLDRLEGLYGDVRKAPHRHLLYPPPTGMSEDERAVLVAPLHEIAEGSEAVFFADTAYYRLLTRLGVACDFMLGHSTGENAAIVSSGIADMTDDEVSSYIRAMNGIFGRIEREGTVPKGVLLSVGAAEPGQVERILEEYADVQLTMDNCPNQKILFGSEERMAEVKAKLAEKGAVCGVLPLSWAYHTEHIRPLADEFGRLFAAVRKGRPRAQLYSCATAAPVPVEDEAAARETLVSQYVSPVRFCEAVRRLHQDGARIFIEVGADNSLSGFVRDSLGALPHLSLSCDNPKRDSLTALLTMLGQLFTAGRFDPSALAWRRARASAAAEPPLPNALPLIYLKPDEAAAARTALFGASAGAAAAPPKAAPVETLAAVPANGAPPPQAASLPPRVLRRDMSSEFSVFESARLALARFDRPFRSGDELMAAARAALTVAELDGPFAGLSERAAGRRQEWLLGRIAAKEAVRALMNGSLTETPAILSDAEGRPIVGQGSGQPYLSISHKNGFAIAAAAHHPVGVDIESLSALRDPDLFADRVLTDDERAFVDASDDMESAVVVFWSLKEAAAKALAAPFVGQERLFTVDAINPATRQARVRFEDQAASLAWLQRDGFVCAVARPLA